jgi:hypothetical protein
MTDKIVNFTGPTTVEIPVEKMLENIDWENVNNLFILTTDKEGYIHAYANKQPTSDMFFMMEKFKFNLLAGTYDQ